MRKNLRVLLHVMGMIGLLVLPEGNSYAQCSADFSLPSNSCQFGTASFTFTGSAGKPKFLWNFGDGFSNFNTDTLRNPVHKFDREGVYNITLIVSDTGRCSDTVKKTIRILKKPKASFTFSQTCANLGTQFKSTSQADSFDSFRSLYWLFGDGGTDYSYEPVHYYAGKGIKTVSLAVNTWNGCTDTLVVNVEIFDQMSISVNKDSACRGDFVSFTINPGTATPGTYIWNFGDATGSYSQNTSHQYNSPGIFTPRATLYFSNGSTCYMDGSPIRIRQLPDASFTVFDSVQCFNYNQVCIKHRIPSSGLTYRSISFDDGYVDNSSPLSDSIICYSYSDTMGGRYTLNSTIIDRYGCVANYSAPFKVHIFPEIEAFFIASNVKGCFKTPFYAKNASNMSPPRVNNYAWDFGDGFRNSSYWDTISHVYTDNGIFNISLAIENTDGCRDTFTKVGGVDNTSYPIDAVMDTALSVCRSDNLFQFRQTPITDAVIYWDFGNLDTAFIFDPDYHYLAPGMYLPRVFLSKNGCPKIIDLDTLYVYGPQAIIGNIVNQYQCNVNDTVILQNTSLYYRNKGLKFFWDVGDPYAPSCISDSIHNLNVGMNCRYSVDSTYVRHMYSKGREACYLPRLIVTDTLVGCTDTTYANVPLMRPNAQTGLQLISKALCLGPEQDKTVAINLSNTLPGCGQEKFWVMWDSTCAAASGNFDDYWKLRQLRHNYGYEMCDSNGRITIGLILQNGLDSQGNVCADTGWYHHKIDFGRINPHFVSDYDPSLHYCKNSTFNFTITDVNQDSLAFIEWNWGDTVQRVTNIRPISHTFRRAGIYRVVLTLRLLDGCVAQDTMTIRVGYYSTFSIPLDKQQICLGDSFRLSKRINYWQQNINYWEDDNRSLAGLETFSWDLDDGNGFVPLGDSPVINYASIGDYSIRMATKDSSGCRDTFTINDGVRIFGISASFSTVRDTFTCAQLISFRSKVTVYDSVKMFGHNDDRVRRYNWSFGKGLSGSVLLNPTKYFKAGTYHVKLLAENTRNCKDSFDKFITVLGPTASFEFAGDSTGCQPLKIRMKNKSVFADAYTWNFGDQGNSAQYTTSDSNMLFTYPLNGRFYPKLTAYRQFISNGVQVTCSNTYPDTPFNPAFRRITVFENPKPGFSQVTNCRNYESRFTNLTVLNTDTITGYEWNFGDGDTSMRKDPVHLYADTGRYQVTLKAYSKRGCAGEIRQMVIISPFPVVWFQKNNVCLGTAINFKDSTESFNDQVKQWEWNFDDGTTSLLKNPIKTYTYDSVFNVSLTVTNYAGCKSSDTIAVRIHGKPKVNFKVTHACLGDRVSLASTTTSKVYPIHYRWNLGDGDTSSSTSISKRYDSAGNYRVILWVKNDFGCYDSLVRTVTIYPLPKASFSIDKHQECQLNNRFTFTNNTTSDTASLIYNWQFGDSTFSSIRHPVKTYDTSGTFYIRLISMTPYNCSDTAYDSIHVNPKPASRVFLSYPLSQCLNSNLYKLSDRTTIYPGSYTRKWDLGDLTTSTDTSITHHYTDSGSYMAKLITMSDRNCPDTLSFKIRVNPHPVASFTIDDSIQCQNTNSFNFTNTSKGFYGSTTSKWLFGDGDTSVNPTGVHHYMAFDSFTVTLIATNTKGCRDTVQDQVIVRPAPNVLFSIKDTLPCGANNLFIFNNLTNNLSGQVSYHWDFGDLTADTSLHPSHSYDTAGVYTVQLSATNDAGCSDTLSKNLRVFSMPLASFKVNDKNQCLNSQDFIFTNTSSSALDSLISYWHLGENDTMMRRHARKTFRSEGLFKVILKVVSSHGCSDSSFMNIVVLPKPSPAITVNDSAQCINAQDFVFGNASVISSGSMTYAWHLGDGTTVNTTPTSYRYTQYGLYRVTLHAVSDSGCIDSVAHSAEVFPKPSSRITMNDSSQCVNTNILVFHAQTSIPYGLVNTFYWNLDSSNYSPGRQDTSMHYRRAGKYGISLVAESAENCRDTSFNTFIIYPVPVSRFTINDSAQCENVNRFIFTNLSTSPGGPLTYNWSFGNGINDTVPSPAISLSSHDTLKVSLVAISENLCRDTSTKAIILFPKPRPEFSVNDSTQCLRGNRFTITNNSRIPIGTMTYSWQTGDSMSYPDVDTGHVYSREGTYTVRLTARSSEGCTDSVQHVYTVYPQPIASFTISNQRQCLNEQSFTISNNSSISKGQLTYLWSFGDGSNSSMTAPVHAYSRHGLYNLWLKVSSAALCPDSMSRPVRVLASPSAVFNVNNTIQCVNSQKLVFNSSASIPQGQVWKYEWDFDDGTKDSGKSVAHYFNYSRFYTVTHTVVSDSLCADTSSQVVRIFPQPEAHFSVNDSAQCLRGNDYTFTDMSYDSFGIQSFNWDLSAGVFSSGKTAKRQFIDTGYKTIRLIVTSVNGCRDTTSRQVYVKRMPNPYFDKPAVHYCQFDPAVTLIPLEPGGLFEGKNISGNIYSPKILWKDTLKYSLIINGCFDSAFQYTNVYPAPKVNLGNDTHLCLYEYLELDVKFWNSKYKWGNSALTDTMFTVTRPGTYFVTVSNICGVASDTIKVTYSDNNCRFFMPNAFSPNHDDHNEYFRPYLINVPEMSMQVYNRWGEKVYDGNQDSKGWDGTYMGQPVQQDVYIWVVFYRYPLGNKHIQIKEKGTFQLLR
jgi:gliding motility-associated-like protein